MFVKAYTSPKRLNLSPGADVNSFNISKMIKLYPFSFFGTQLIQQKNFYFFMQQYVLYVQMQLNQFQSAF